jgi:hypothetical protein
MLKLKSFINALLLLTISLCIYPIDSSISGGCDEEASSGSTPTFTDDYNYTDNWNTSPELDPSIPEEIAPNSSIPLTVSGGCSPYTWSVSGTGFTLENEGQPTGATNTLYADGTACGSATITVTGCSGPPVTGYVRSTEGQWSADDFYDSGCGTAPLHGCYVNEVRGHMRLHIIAWCIYTGSDGCGICNTNCEEVTGTPMDDVDISCNHPTYHECFPLRKYINYWECAP